MAIMALCLGLLTSLQPILIECLPLIKSVRSHTHTHWVALGHSATSVAD